MYDHLICKVQVKCKWILCLNLDPIPKVPCCVYANIPNSETSWLLGVLNHAIRDTEAVLCFGAIYVFFLFSSCLIRADNWAVLLLLWAVSPVPLRSLWCRLCLSVQPVLQARSRGLSCPRVGNLKATGTAVEGQIQSEQFSVHLNENMAFCCITLLQFLW